MKIKPLIIFIVVGLAWLALAAYVLYAAGINLRNIIVVVMSGILVFMPLCKRYGNRKD